MAGITPQVSNTTRAARPAAAFATLKVEIEDHPPGMTWSEESQQVSWKLGLTCRRV